MTVSSRDDSKKTIRCEGIHLTGSETLSDSQGRRKVESGETQH